MRILGLDIGDKTIGVAVSDLLGYTAQGLETIRFRVFSESFKRLAEIIREYNVAEIICGLPLNMDGSEGTQAARLRKRADELKNYLNRRNLPPSFRFWDERLSTVASQRTLLEADLSRAKRKKVIDKMAACFILQGYLDSRLRTDFSN